MLFPCANTLSLVGKKTKKTHPAPGPQPPERTKSLLAALDMIALKQLTSTGNVPWHSGAAVWVLSGNVKFKMWPGWCRTHRRLPGEPVLGQTRPFPLMASSRSHKGVLEPFPGNFRWMDEYWFNGWCHHVWVCCVVSVLRAAVFVVVFLLKEQHTEREKCFSSGFTIIVTGRLRLLQSYGCSGVCRKNYHINTTNKDKGSNNRKIKLSCVFSSRGQ